jgi:hypothetical protein
MMCFTNASNLVLMAILLLHLLPPVPCAEIRVTSTTFQLSFPEAVHNLVIDVMDSFLIGQCLHMSLHVNGRDRKAIMRGLSSLVFEDQRDLSRFSTGNSAISASRIFTHTSGKVIEDYHICTPTFQKPLSVAVLCPRSSPGGGAGAAVNPKKFYIYRLFRGIDDNSLAVHGTSLSSYLDTKAIYNVPPRDISSCTVARLRDLKFSRLWVEYHRVVLWSPKIYLYVLVDQKNFFETKDWRVGLSSVAIRNIEWLSIQADVEIVEWPLIAKELGAESAHHACLQRQHVLRHSLVTYASEVTDFLRFSKSMLSVMDVVSYLSPQCNYLSPNVYASVIRCEGGVGNKSLQVDDCVSFSEMRPIKASCRGRFNGLLVAQSRVVNLNSFKLVSNHPKRSFAVSNNRTVKISNEYYRKPFPAMANYIDVINHDSTCR